MPLLLTNLEKCKGAMLASAIGDALGWPNETRANNTMKNAKKSDYFIEWTRRCSGPNWHYEKILPGEYSDDTQMILAVARSIIAGNWENIFSYKELPYWLEYQRGGGRALLKAANSCKKGILLWQSANSHEYFNAGGNGAVMRILPHVIVSSKKNFSEELILNVIKDSIITHGHPRAILGATCYAYALNYLLKKESILEYGELVAAVLGGQKEWGAFPDKEMFEDWVNVATHITHYNYLKEWDIVLANMVKQLQYISSVLKKGLMLDDREVLTHLECFGKVSGAGDVAILAAIYLASRYANNPVLGIKTPALLVGMDTDTIASITGGLLGMLCGCKWIPLEWRNVQDYNCLLQTTEMLLSDDMAETAKKVVVDVKKKYNDWGNTPIGKMHLIDTVTITKNKGLTVLINKWESTLGQTLYFKEYKRNSRDVYQSNQKVILSSERSRNDFEFAINTSDIVALLGKPELQRITFRKVMKVIERLMTTNDSVDSIAKQMEVDIQVVNLLKNFIK